MRRLKTKAKASGEEKVRRQNSREYLFISGYLIGTLYSHTNDGLFDNLRYIT
jgi:hypothetical protein